MRPMRIRVGPLLAWLFTLGAMTAAGAAQREVASTSAPIDPAWIGTWELNVARSVCDPSAFEGWQELTGR